MKRFRIINKNNKKPLPLLTDNDTRILTQTPPELCIRTPIRINPWMLYDDHDNAVAITDRQQPHGNYTLHIDTSAMQKLK